MLSIKKEKTLAQNISIATCEVTLTVLLFFSQSTLKSLQMYKLFFLMNEFVLLNILKYAYKNFKYNNYTLIRKYI